MSCKITFHVSVSFSIELTIENVNVYAGFLMAVGILGMISFGLSFSICYMKKRPFKPEQQFFKFQKEKF
jgi:hypothetical protein